MVAVAALIVTTLAAFSAPPAHAVPALPPLFVPEDAVPGAGFVVPVGIAFFPGGRMLVAEKAGRVFTARNGVKNATPMWDRQAEVLSNGDRGLLGIAVDPRYNGTTNRWIYLLYTVDPDSNNNDTDSDGFGRLVRVQVSAADSNVVDYSTRQVLFGATWRQGPVSGADSHTIGSLRFGGDGSLIISVGDGAQYGSTDFGGQDGGAFSATRTDPFEDIGAFRAQYTGSLAGKILRLNPDTGGGYSSNPFYDGNPFSVPSRVWAYGLRNPYRFCVRPSTGSTDPAAGSPGTLYIGDVGWTAYEETNITRIGGRNFGWPCFEGAGANSSYQSASPAHHGCGTIGVGDNPSPHTAPVSWWHHSTDAASSPTGFHGNTSIGGVFYRGTSYPAQYRNQYFFADYGQSWMRVGVMDANDNQVQQLAFGTAMDGPVDLNVDPVTGDLMYVAINVQQVRRIRYTGAGGGNTPPVANLSATPASGPAPLAVAFSAAGSSDADGDLLTYTWAYGDGTANGSGLTVNHTYVAAGSYTAQLTVSDGRGGVTPITQTINATGGASGAFPSTPVLDAFTRANGAIGGSWTGLTTGLTVSANELVSTGVASSPVWNGAVFGADQEAYVTFRSVTAGAQEHDLMLKVQGTSYTGGHIEVRYTAPLGQVQVSTYTAATQWVNRGSPLNVTFAAGDRLGARALADGTIEVYKNLTLLGTRSAGDWPFASQGGRLGMTFDGITATRLDDFGGGNVVFGTVNTKPTATILAPANNSFFVAPTPVALSGNGSDGQTPSDSLTYQWVADLYHNTHLHPSVFTASGKTASMPTEQHDDGTGVWEQVMLIVTDPGGLRDTAKVNLYPETDLMPSAITVTPPSPTFGQSAQFSFRIRNLGRMPAPISRWALRAGGTLIAQGDTIVQALDSVTVTRSFSGLAAGTFALRARVDSLGTVTETNEANNAVTQTLVVIGPPNQNPVANATGAPLTGVATLNVNFSSAGSSDPDGDPLTYAWAFGDGGTSAAANPPHPYTGAGTFNAILTVSDNRGGSARDTVVVTVTPPPASGFPATPVLDNFNRVNGAIGSPWENSGGLSILSNTLKPIGAYPNTAWNGAIYGANQEAYLTFATLSGGVEYILMLKMQGQFWHNGHIEVNYEPTSGAVRVTTYAPSGGWVTRGFVNASFAAGDRFGARALANGNVTIYKNGVSLGTVSVSGWAFAALGGRIGISFSNATGSSFDDFGGGDAPAAAQAALPSAADAPRAEAAIGLPATLALGAPRPNPSSGDVTFALELPSESEVGFTVHDLQGRVVWRESRSMAAGRWMLRWDGRTAEGPARPGVYLARVSAGETAFLRRVVIVR